MLFSCFAVLTIKFNKIIFFLDFLLSLNHLGFDWYYISKRNPGDAQHFTYLPLAGPAGKFNCKVTAARSIRNIYIKFP